MLGSFFENQNIYIVALSEKETHGFRLSPEEEALLSKEVTAKRRREFTLGRAAAHQALKNAGFTIPPPVLKGESGEPLWPEGVVGSITHCKGKSVAILSLNPMVKALGIDLQALKENLNARLDERICLQAEKDWVNENPSYKIEKLTKIFSAKESIYKAVYSYCGEKLVFSDVLLVWDESLTGFLGTLQRDVKTYFLKGHQFKIFCSSQDDTVLTVFVI